MTKKPHWTQTEEGKKRMSEIQKLAHRKIRQVKRANGVIKKKQEDTSIVINGWRVSLGRNEIRIIRMDE